MKSQPKNLYEQQISSLLIEIKTSLSYVYGLFFDEKGDDDRLNKVLQIYDFNLNLINRISLDFYDLFKYEINNDEVAFENQNNFKISIYNAISLKKKTINFKDKLDNKFYNSKPNCSKLVHFTKENLYFLIEKKSICIINREKGELVQNIYSNESEIIWGIIKFDEHSNIYINIDENKILVYDSNGEAIHEIVLKELFKRFKFNDVGVLIFNQKSQINLIQYDEY